MAPLSLKPGEGVWVDRLKIENFRSIASLELAFRYRLTLLIGDNGAGKTTVLDALAAVLQDTHPLDRRPSVSDLRRSAGKPATKARVQSFQNGVSIDFSIGSDSVTPNGSTHGGIDTIKAYYGAERAHGVAFQELVDWFEAKDAEEARQIRELQNLEYRNPELAEVRRVVERMIPGTVNLRIDSSTKTLVVEQSVAGTNEKFDVTELAGGMRTMLVLVADLQRMILSNTGRSSPAKVLVLIDEIDLHLHPRWQLQVMENLLAAFPLAQFIITTHSEEIIASVPSECVVSLQNRNGRVIAASIPPVQGATFDRVLEDAMGVPGHRPPHAQRQLDEYWKFVDAGAGDSPEALSLRSQLDELFKGQEPELVRADLVIRRKRARSGTGT